MSEGILALAAPVDEVIVHEAAVAAPPEEDDDFIVVDQSEDGGLPFHTPGPTFGQTVISAGHTAYTGAYARAVVIGSTIAEHAPAVGQGIYDGVTTVSYGIVYGANAVGNGIAVSTPYIVSAASGLASFVAGVSSFVAELSIRTFGPVIPAVLEGAGGVAEGLGKGANGGLTFLGNKIGTAVESYTRDENKNPLN